MKVIRINHSGTILFNQDNYSMTFYRIEGDRLHIIYRHTQQIPIQISVGEWSVSDLFFLLVETQPEILGNVLLIRILCKGIFLICEYN